MAVIPVGTRVEIYDSSVLGSTSIRIGTVAGHGNFHGGCGHSYEIVFDGEITPRWVATGPGSLFAVVAIPNAAVAPGWQGPYTTVPLMGFSVFPAPGWQGFNEAATPVEAAKPAATVTCGTCRRNADANIACWWCETVNVVL
jgi:hypothetical protein